MFERSWRQPPAPARQALCRYSEGPRGRLRLPACVPMRGERLEHPPRPHSALPTSQHCWRRKRRHSTEPPLAQDELRNQPGEGMIDWSRHLKHENPSFSETFNAIVARLSDHFDVGAACGRRLALPRAVEGAHIRPQRSSARRRLACGVSAHGLPGSDTCCCAPVTVDHACAL